MHSFLHMSFLLQLQTFVFINLMAVWWGKTAGAQGLAGGIWGLCVTVVSFTSIFIELF